MGTYMPTHPQPTGSKPTHTFSQVEPPLERILRPDRVYVIDVEMRVPESPANAALGNWMVQVCVYADANLLVVGMTSRIDSVFGGGKEDGSWAATAHLPRRPIWISMPTQLTFKPPFSLSIYLQIYLKVDLLTKDGQLLGRSARPLILHYRSRIVRVRLLFPLLCCCVLVWGGRRTVSHTCAHAPPTPPPLYIPIYR